MILQPLLFASSYSVKCSVYIVRKEISSSFQKCIGLYTLYAIVLRNLTSNWPNTIDVNDDQWRHLFTTHTTDVMTSNSRVYPETIAWWRHSSCTASFLSFFKNVWLAQKMPLLVKFLFNFFGFKIKADSKLLQIFLWKLHVDSFFEWKGVSPQDFVV